MRIDTTDVVETMARNRERGRETRLQIRIHLHMKVLQIKTESGKMDGRKRERALNETGETEIKAMLAHSQALRKMSSQE